MLLLEKRKVWTVDDLFIVCVCAYVCTFACVDAWNWGYVCACFLTCENNQKMKHLSTNRAALFKIQTWQLGATIKITHTFAKLPRPPYHVSRVALLDIQCWSKNWIDLFPAAFFFFSRSESCPSRQEHIHSACLCFFETPFSVGSSIDCDFSIYSPFSTLFCLSEIVLLTCIVFGSFLITIHHTIWARKEEFIQEIADTRRNHRCVLEPPSRSRNTSSISRPFNSLQKPLVSFFLSRRKYSSDVLWFQSERSNRVKHLFSLPMSGSNL